ncbi:unknown [Ligilactobacillus ruminis CAG:367]|nr:unknown [Ligilactobacillus ruminis CAG:367]
MPAIAIMRFTFMPVTGIGMLSFQRSESPERGWLNIRSRLQGAAIMKDNGAIKDTVHGSLLRPRGCRGIGGSEISIFRLTLTDC